MVFRVYCPLRLGNVTEIFPRYCVEESFTILMSMHVIISKFTATFGKIMYNFNACIIELLPLAQYNSGHCEMIAPLNTCHNCLHLSSFDSHFACKSFPH